MIPKPYRCEWHHRFTKAEAERLRWRCDRDRTRIELAEALPAPGGTPAIDATSAEGAAIEPPAVELATPPAED